MAAPSKQRKVFDFFRLPRELRDMIYDYSALLDITHHTEYEKDPNYSKGWKFTYTSLTTNILGVSAQIRREYMERCYHKCHLVISLPVFLLISCCLSDCAAAA